MKKEGGKYVFEINAGSSKFSIIPEEGAVITQWSVDNKNQVNGKICLNRLYLPKLKSSYIDGTFQLKSQLLENKSLKIIFEHNLSGLNIIKSFSFAPDGKSFKVNCDIINKSKDIQTVGFWYWNTFTAGMWKNKPYLQTGSKLLKDKKYINSTIFYETSKAPMVKNLLSGVDYENNKGQKTFALKSSNGTVVLSSKSPDTAGFLTWVVSKKKFSTLELLFKAKSLRTGEKASYPLVYEYQDK